MSDTTDTDEVVDVNNNTGFGLESAADKFFNWYETLNRNSTFIHNNCRVLLPLIHIGFTSKAYAYPVFWKSNSKGRNGGPSTYCHEVLGRSQRTDFFPLWVPSQSYNGGKRITMINSGNSYDPSKNEHGISYITLYISTGPRVVKNYYIFNDYKKERPSLPRDIQAAKRIAQQMQKCASRTYHHSKHHGYQARGEVELFISCAGVFQDGIEEVTMDPNHKTLYSRKLSVLKEFIGCIKTDIVDNNQLDTKICCYHKDVLNADLLYRTVMDTLGMVHRELQYRDTTPLSQVFLGGPKKTWYFAQLAKICITLGWSSPKLVRMYNKWNNSKRGLENVYDPDCILLAKDTNEHTNGPSILDNRTVYNPDEPFTERTEEEINLHENELSDICQILQKKAVVYLHISIVEV